MSTRNLREAQLAQIYTKLLEKFGEKIHDQHAGVGAADEGPGGKATYIDGIVDEDWSDPDVVTERGTFTDRKCPECGETLKLDGHCPECGHEESELDEVAPEGWEGTVKAMKKHPEIKNPWALAHSMKNKGYKSHRGPRGGKKD